MSATAAGSNPAQQISDVRACPSDHEHMMHEIIFACMQGTLDWLAFSVDASNDETHAIMGRGLQAELVRRSTTTSLSSSSSVMISSADLELPVPVSGLVPSRPPQQGLAARQV